MKNKIFQIGPYLASSHLYVLDDNRVSIESTVMPKNSSILKLNPRHFKIIDLAVSGLTVQQIATQLDMSPRMVGVVINSPPVQHEIAVRRKAFEEDFDQKQAERESEVAGILQSSSNIAAKTLTGLLLSSNEAIKFKSAEAILDRTGHPRTSRSVSETAGGTVININTEDLTLLSETFNLTRRKRVESSEQTASSPDSDLRTEDSTSSTSSQDEKVNPNAALLAIS